ncbi:conserved exported hypothetical protein [Bradyrhizobium sp. STM 3843]|uniref:GCG_CRPN prefix-to-repeats domain-containing protein n=1 Tax=Bradyrhizobium sp. STM 3843 TaxID=551947 RepID=UPI00024034B7|nr:hypothetical protein [Bradyrhizobium sp. STM 3843]CCE11978.1 conserved exported hypothetical protein [Bradyrhizobium sp. STM 3843]
MRKLLLSIALAATAALAGSAAQAFTLPAQPSATEDNIVRVAGGCGLGWHRGPWGGCRPNYYYGAGYAYVGPGYYHPAGACFWRVTPYGRRWVCAW